ncbi:DUF4426 domain-containing protein [Aliikangiella sp. G2MR2-5]|uniref:DUF4426 domain-containing protein n=1 Tax=Aliikangiella sp. G2MR2-5 TaxID=2788943 RepID=UPI0018A8A92C|nr:DUF4426 domain-containing protein [Aliikangiella sp. G2MR2-5]
MNILSMSKPYLLMKKVKVRLKPGAKILASLVILCGSLHLNANQHSVGEVTIHYNALSSIDIPAEVAAQYGITRGGRTGLINIAVQKSGKPVIANIFGHGKNLTGQLKELAFKEIKEESAIYYIATFSFNNGEKVTFDLQIQSEKTGKLIPLAFSQTLYSN